MEIRILRTIYQTIDEFMKNDLFMCSFFIHLIWKGYIHISEVERP